MRGARATGPPGSPFKHYRSFVLQDVGLRAHPHAPARPQAGNAPGLDRSEVPLCTNASQNGIRCEVTKGKISGGIQTTAGRGCRDAGLGLAKANAKLRISFRDYPGNTLGATGSSGIPLLRDILMQRATA